MIENTKRNKKVFELLEKGLSMQNVGDMLCISRQRVYQIFHNISNSKKPKYSQNKYQMLILKRDKKKCVLCDRKENIIVHHIDKNIKNNLSNNLITLCRKCHTKIHNKEQFNYETEIYNKYINITNNL